MSGHSRWAQIKRKKGKTVVQRGKLFSKILREITVAAKNGGGDPKANMRLKAAMESAKEANMPADNVKRAVQKGTGELPGESYEEISYEGYAPSGVAIMVEAMTDNRNRTAAAVRHAFTKCGGNLGTDGSVAYLFERKGQISFAPGVDEDALMEAAMEADADDVVANDDGSFDVFTSFNSFYAVRNALEEAGFKAADAEIVMQPTTSAELDQEGAEKVLKLIDMLEDLDDVQNVYSNAQISDEIMENLG